MNPYKVFILLATYNRAHLVTETLKSIQNQTYKDWECIIVDDFSTDGNENVIKSFITSDPRFSFYPKVKKYSKGLSGSRNYGLDLAEQKGAQFIQFVDDDDILHPENLRVCLSFLRSNNIDFCHFKKESFTNEIPALNIISNNITNFNIGSDEIDKVVCNEIALASCTVMWKRECFAENHFLEELTYAEEWELYIRILLENFSGLGINVVLYFNRKHSQSNTGEFWQGNEGRKDSYIKAATYVAESLSVKNKISIRTLSYLVQLSINLKSQLLLNHVLLKFRVNSKTKLRYKLFYKLYPVVILGYRSKMFLKKILNEISNLFRYTSRGH